jgi:hypothetical protein
MAAGKVSISANAAHSDFCCGHLFCNWISECAECLLQNRIIQPRLNGRLLGIGEETPDSRALRRKQLLISRKRKRIENFELGLVGVNLLGCPGVEILRSFWVPRLPPMAHFMSYQKSTHERNLGYVGAEIDRIRIVVILGGKVGRRGQLLPSPTGSSLYDLTTITRIHGRAGLGGGQGPSGQAHRVERRLLEP